MFLKFFECDGDRAYKLKKTKFIFSILILSEWSLAETNFKNIYTGSISIQDVNSNK